MAPVDVILVPIVVGNILLGTIRISYQIISLIYFFLFGPTAPLPPPVGHGILIHEVSRSRTTTHHIR